MKELFICEYHGRLLILRKREEFYSLYYRSSGVSTPELKSEGEVFPILGILGVGEVGKAVKEFYSGIGSSMADRDGWIAKNVAKDGRKNIASYFHSEKIRSAALELEEVLKSDIASALSSWEFEIRTMPSKEWFELVDKVAREAGSRCFVPYRLISMAQKQKAGS